MPQLLQCLEQLVARVCHVLPRLACAAYVESVRRVVASLSESIAFEADGASERAVRRNADPAKADIERFIRDWKGAAVVADEPSYAALVGARSVSRGRPAQASSRVPDICFNRRAPLPCFAPAEALRQLGAFYTASGSRAALTPAVRSAVLAALRDAEAALG
jgi:hypothetical protein